jgi:hypothetical protein
MLRCAVSYLSKYGQFDCESFQQEMSSKFMNVTEWEHHTFENKIFGYGKVYYSNSIIITNFVQTLIPSCWFENVFPTDFGIEIS